MPGARRVPSDLPPIALRELNRALLARQMLLRRERVPVAAAVERLGALQAQFSPAPYVALWSRLERFAIADLEKALAAKKVVKATLMRGTLHICSSPDHKYYALAAREARKRVWGTVEKTLLRYFAKDLPAGRTGGMGDPERIHAAVLRFAARTPRSREDLIAFLAERTDLPTTITQHLVWSFIATYGGLVHAPPSGTWAYRRSGSLIAARTWLGQDAPPSFEDAVRHSVRRYLAAFGPASADDISTWTHIRVPPIREALAALGTKVRTFRAETGALLHDLAASPRPPADTAAPVRFLPKWDSTLLAYVPADRIRILPEKYRRAVIIKNGDVAQTFLVDGTVAGTWDVAATPKQALLTVRPFGALPRSARADLLDEGESLARFVAAGSGSHGVRVGPRP
ncbi:MAG: winged helix DNA-binding domain-containing protein [Candidatus Limnocylindria bacterium]